MPLQKWDYSPYDYPWGVLSKAATIAAGVALFEWHFR